MVIEISDLKRPGEILDSSKLAILSNRISGGIQQRTKGQFIVNVTIKGLTMKITIRQINPETGKAVPISRNEQELLGGRVSQFLNGNGVSHKIRIT